MSPAPEATTRSHPTNDRPTRQRRVRRVGALAILMPLMLVASACGGDDGASPSAGGDGDGATVSADPDNCPTDALDGTDGVTDVTVWHAYDSLTQQTLEDATTAYNNSQDRVKVSVEAQGTYPELLKKYEDSLGNPASLPDVVFSEDTTLQFMFDSGSVINSSDCIAADPDAEEFYDDLLPAIRNAYTVQDQLVAAAYGVSMPIMYVNNAHLGAAGLSTDEYPATLDEVRAAAEKIKAANIPGLEAPVVMQLYGWYPENWLTGAGEYIVDGENGRDELATTSEFDSAATAEIVNWMNDMQADGLLKAYPYSSDISQFLAVANQSASILIDGSRAITTVDAVVQNSYAPTGDDAVGDATEALGDEDLTGLDISVAPVPGLDEAGQGAVWGSAAFLVAGGDDASIAGGWEFLQYFNRPETQAQWTLQGSYLPVTEAGQENPEVQTYFADATAGRWLSAVNDQLLSIDPDFPGPAIGPYNQFRAGLHSMLDDVVLGDAEPGPAIAEFSDSFQDELMNYADEVG